MATATMMAAAVLLTSAGGQSTMGSMAMPSGHATPAACTAPAPLPADLTGFADQHPLAAAASADAAPTLPLGRGAKVGLAAGPIRWAATPDHAPVAGSHGGLLAIAITAAGRYRIALGSGAWVDMVRDGAPLRSIAHSHAPACTAVKKMVDFDLQPGRYVLQLSGTAEPTLGVMVIRLAS